VFGNAAAQRQTARMSVARAIVSSSFC